LPAPDVNVGKKETDFEKEEFQTLKVLWP